MRYSVEFVQGGPIAPSKISIPRLFSIGGGGERNTVREWEHRIAGFDPSIILSGTRGPGPLGFWSLSRGNHQEKQCAGRLTRIRRRAILTPTGDCGRPDVGDLIAVPLVSELVRLGGSIRVRRNVDDSDLVAIQCRKSVNHQRWDLHQDRIRTPAGGRVQDNFLDATLCGRPLPAIIRGPARPSPPHR